ncbi:MAG TPA: hypothetical protein VHT53_06575 [Candidatus Elarobacter sp.]|nr:hypothetical protein [Candidatus Elarobacter sp.]
MIRSVVSAVAAVAAAIVIVCGTPSRAVAQAAPSPTPSPSPAPNPLGPQFGPNDPCTTLSAIVSRPTVTNSVCTVRPNHVEIETGYLNATASSGGGNTVTYPQALVRVGTVVPALELDLTPPQVTRTSASGIVTGTTDAGAGLKYVFGYSPKFSWGGQAFFTAPTGTNGFSANGTDATYALNAAYTLTPVFAVATTLAANAQTDGLRRWPSFVPSFVVTAALPNNTSLYGEIATFSNAAGAGTPTRTQYIYGVSRDLGPRLQLDASVAVSPTTATGAYHGVGFGVSYYF